MEKKTSGKSPVGISRRDFIKSMGTGAIGTAVLPPFLGRRIATKKGREAADEAVKDASPLRENGYKADLIFAALKKAVMAVGA